jgi:hypothetical protein
MLVVELNGSCADYRYAINGHQAMIFFSST